MFVRFSTVAFSREQFRTAEKIKRTDVCGKIYWVRGQPYTRGIHDMYLLGRYEPADSEDQNSGSPCPMVSGRRNKKSVLSKRTPVDDDDDDDVSTSVSV